MMPLKNAVSVPSLDAINYTKSLTVKHDALAQRQITLCGFKFTVCASL